MIESHFNLCARLNNRAQRSKLLSHIASPSRHRVCPLETLTKSASIGKRKKLVVVGMLAMFFATGTRCIRHSSSSWGVTRNIKEDLACTNPNNVVEARYYTKTLGVIHFVYERSWPPPNVSSPLDESPVGLATLCILEHGLSRHGV